MISKEALENHKCYLERKAYFKKFGYDIDKERSFIFKKAMPVQGRILEVGTGKGHFTMELAKAGYCLTSVDISEEEQIAARLNLEFSGLKDKVVLRVENAEKLSFSDGSFDAVFSVNAVHHFKDTFRVMDELVRVTARPGKIVLSDFSEEGFKVIECIHGSEGKTHDRGAVSMKAVKDHLTGKGFRTEEYGTKFQDIVIAYRKIV
ncbi:MAG: class I SAM-dependent methyltransferase [Candidatus Omnitrophota bacterium]